MPPKRKRDLGSGGLNENISLIRSELSLLEEPPYDVSLTNSFIVEHYPVNAVNDKSVPIQFHIPGSDNQFIDLRDTRIHVRGKILLVDGKPIADTDIVAPVNIFLHSLFSQCIVWLNENQITPPNMYYPYRAYIDMLLGYGKEFTSAVQYVF